MPRGLLERGWGGAAGKKFIIQEGITEMKASKEEEEHRAAIMEQVELLQDKIYHELQDYYDYGYVGENAFLTLQEIFETAKNSLSLTELKNIIQPLYPSFEIFEYDSDTRKNVCDLIGSYRNFQRIYGITGIEPSRDFSEFDLDSGRGLKNLFSNPARALFFQHKDESNFLEKMPTSNILRNIIEADHTLTEVEACCQRLILNRTMPIGERISYVLNFQHAFPEMHLKVSSHTAEKLYTEIIDAAVERAVASSYTSTTDMGDDQELLSHIMDVRRLVGSSLNQIAFKQSDVSSWYAKIIPTWVHGLSTNAYGDGYCTPTITTIERITRISPDFSPYREEIQKHISSRVANAERNKYFTGVIKLREYIESIKRFTGLPLDMHGEKIHILAKREAGDYINQIAAHIEYLNTFNRHNIHDLQKERYEKLSEIKKVFGDNFHADRTVSKNMFDAILTTALKKQCWRFDDEGLEILRDYITIIGDVSGSSCVELGPDKVRDVFDALILHSDYHASSPIKPIDLKIIPQFEHILKVRKVFSSKGREMFMARITDVRDPNFSLSAVKRDATETLGSFTGADMQHIYSETLRALPPQEGIKKIRNYYHKTNFQPTAASVIPVILEHPQYATYLEDVAMGKNKTLVHDGGFVKMLWQKLEKSLWYQSVMHLRSQFPDQNQIRLSIEELRKNREISFYDETDATILHDFFNTFGLLNDAKLFALYKEHYKNNDFSLLDERVVDIFCDRINNSLRSEDWTTLLKIGEKFNCLTNTECQKSIFKKLGEILEAFETYNSQDVYRFIAIFNISTDQVSSVFDAVLMKNLVRGHIQNILKISRYFPLLGSNFFTNESNKPLFEQQLLYLFNDEKFLLAEELSHKLKYSSEQIDGLVKIAIVKNFSRGSFGKALAIMDKFPLVAKKFNEETVEYFQKALKAKDIEAAVRIQNIFYLPPEKTISTIVGVATSVFADDTKNDIILGYKMLNMTHLDVKSDFLIDGAPRAALFKAIIRYVKHSKEDKNFTAKIIAEFNISAAEVSSMMHVVIKHCIHYGDFNKALELKKRFAIENTEFSADHQTMVDGIVKNLTRNFSEESLDQVTLLITEFNIDFSQHKEVSKKIVPIIKQQLFKDPLYIEKCTEELWGKHIVLELKNDPWCMAFLRLQKIQKINKNEKVDPWRLELKPLINKLLETKTISIERPEDADLLVNFVGDFGMINVFNTFKVYACCHQTEKWDDVPVEIRTMLNEYGIALKKNDEQKSWRFPNPKHALNELRRAAEQFRSDLLTDVIPDVAVSVLGKEQFTRLVGSTQWSKNFTLEHLLNLWKKTTTESPSVGQLPPGYTEAEFKTHLIARNNTSAFDQALQEQKIKMILESKEVKEQYLPLADALYRAINLKIQSAYWLNKQRDLLRTLQESISELEHVLTLNPGVIDTMMSGELDSEKRIVLEKKKKALASDKGRLGIQKQLDSLRNSLSMAEQLDFAFSNDEEIIKTMETLAKISGSSSEVATLLRDVSAVHMLHIASAGWQTTVTEHFGRGSQPTVERIRGLNGYLRDHIREHYLQAEQVEEHTGHKPFSKNLYLALERAWQQQSAGQKMTPIEQVVLKINQTLDPEKYTQKENTAITMVPVSGLLNIYSGYTGNACFTSQQNRVANGDFPKLRSWIYVTGRNTNTEVLRGSLLGIETTERDTGIPVLVARANNPQENFIQSVDQEQFVIGSLQEVVSTARRMQIARLEEAQKNGTVLERKLLCQQVAFPMDASGGSSTNRPLVSGVYRRRWNSCKKIGLENQPETNFNGYAIWDDKGSRACVKIWEIDANGNETWYGDWIHEGMNIEQLKSSFRYYIENNQTFDASLIKKYNLFANISKNDHSILVDLAKKGIKETYDATTQHKAWLAVLDILIIDTKIV